MAQFDDQLHTTKVAELHHQEEEALIRTLAPKYGCSYVNLDGFTIDPDALALVPEAEAKVGGLAVFAEKNKQLSIAVRDPRNPETIKTVENLHGNGYVSTLFLASDTSLRYAWERYHDIKSATAEERGVLDVNPDAITGFSDRIHSHLDIAELIREIREKNGAERITETIEVVFGGALALGASDVHIEPEAAAIRVRYRLDGVLWDIVDVEKKIYTLLLSRLKLLSGLKLNIHDIAQDGRFTFDIGSNEIEVRTSVIPGAFGETVVMRLLDPKAASFSIDHLGLPKVLYDVITEELSRPNGAIVTTGPTGSGKTSALYAFLKEVHKPGVKIITIEDPVEYRLEGIVQTQVGDEYTFASGLRAILRQDPDVLLIGEIRDREVAETAVHAALTGHLVFSTLHTNSAVGAFPRLIDMGVDSRMIGSAFNLIMAQRLVRKLCEHCKIERDATTEEQVIIGRIIDQPVAMHRIFDATGCERCGGSGYKGRTGIFEAIRVNEHVEEAIIHDPRESNILAAAKNQGIPSMQQDGIMKVLAGITSLDELARVVDLYKKIGGDETDTTTIDEHTI